MNRDDESAPLRHRLSRFRLVLKRTEEPLATTLLQNAVSDLETRLAVMENSRQNAMLAAPHGAAQQQQQPQTGNGTEDVDQNDDPDREEDSVRTE